MVAKKTVPSNPLAETLALFREHATLLRAQGAKTVVLNLSADMQLVVEYDETEFVPGTVH
jgi:hypothetical protein